MARSNFGMPKLRKGPVVFICPCCGGDLERRMRKPGKTMMVVCPKGTKLGKGSDDQTDDCKFEMTIQEAHKKLEVKN